MQQIDFTQCLDRGGLDAVFPQNAWLVNDVYGSGEGLQLRESAARGALIQDVVRLGEGAFLFASDYIPRAQEPHRQIVNGSDWIHVQFRLSGAGFEQVSDTEGIQVPDRCCVVSRYPAGSTIERRLESANRWKVVCLLITPSGLTHILDMRAPGLPPPTQWLAMTESSEPCTQILPLQPAMVMAANDVLVCPFRGSIRRAYMRAKSLELLSAVLHGLLARPEKTGSSGLKLSAKDLQRLASARALMNESLDCALTLSQLACRLGLNRTKLALGFKEVYGTSVQAYWRDIRLTRARELLNRGEACVTEVALEVGYSELSSFTRAFIRKFGILPRACRSPRTEES